LKKEMTEEFIGISVSCLILYPVISGYVSDENPKKSNNEEEGNKMFLKLYEQCLNMNTERMCWLQTAQYVLEPPSKCNTSTVG